MALDKTGGYYIRHINAMTAEGLHSKADIAAELAYRDAQIDDLRAENERLREALKKIVDEQHALTIFTSWSCGCVHTVDAVDDMVDIAREALAESEEK